MNEFNKLLTSLLLLGAGFFAASFIGPPEVVDRLSWYLSSPASEDPQGLRPMPFGTPVTDETGWPERPAPEAVASAPRPAPPTERPSRPTAAVSAMIAPASWPGERANDPGPAAPAQAGSVAPPPLDDDWLNASTFDRQESHSPATLRAASPAAAAPARPLTPIERTPHTVAKEPTVWPELRSPLAEPAPSAPAPSAPASLDNSPYGARPSFDASASTSAFPPLTPNREAAPGSSLAPVQRQPVATTYTQHVVTDGDTLPTIAERYLGDSARAQELFELNRDRLDHPDVLPIGMVLRAPERRAALPVEAPASHAFPPREPAGAFTTVAAHEEPGAYARPATHAVARPVTPLHAAEEPPLTESQRLGPADPLYHHEVSWDENRW
ncbi:LysM domain/BON superfamily protein [Planctomycetes bacterium MalM25]|nr:LysM domain/BON superfamily protein [Planctomycetes bacterium MalM25]